jgi:hypothetical protein
MVRHFFVARLPATICVPPGGAVMIFSLAGLAAANLVYLILHVTNSGSFPRPLTADEERRCLERLRAGDESARNELIEHNLRLVAHIIKKYYSNARDQDDLISIGTIGLIKAVSTFDSGKGTRLATLRGALYRERDTHVFSQPEKDRAGRLHK